MPIFLTDNVMLYDSGSYLSCCTIGFHGHAGLGRHDREGEELARGSADADLRGLDDAGHVLGLPVRLHR